jgi:hypothetical protein
MNTISSHTARMVMTHWQTDGLFTNGAIMRTINGRVTKQLRREPYDKQLSCTVPRGRGHSNVALLPGGTLTGGALLD